MKKQKIEVSHRTIIFTFLFAGLLWLVYKVRGVIILLFWALILMSILKPLVALLEKKLKPKWAILIAYLLTLGAVGGILALIITPLAIQTSSLVSQIPNLAGQIPVVKNYFGIQDFSFLGGELVKLPQRIFQTIVSAASNLVNLLTVLILTYFMLREREQLPEYLTALFGDQKQQAIKVVKKVEKVIGNWARGQLILMVIIAIVSYIGLMLLGFPSAIPLALLAGFLEFIPNLGPTLATVPAALIGFSISPLMGVTAIVLYWLIQQLENNFLVPKVMADAVDISPLVAIVLLLSGYKIAGIVGTILAIPVFLVTRVVVTEFYRLKNQTS